MNGRPVAVVTGAGSGIGVASARAFSEAGYAVCLLDLDKPAVVEAAESLPGASLPIRCDVAAWDEVSAAFEQISLEFGRVDALHANAGSEGYFVFEEISVDEIRRQVDVNLIGQLLCAKAALPLLAASSSGSIVFTASVQGHLTLPGCVPYAAAKAGLMAVARALAVELGERGIRVNTVSPGTIDTPMLERSLEGMSLDDAEASLAQLRSANALGRIGEPRDVADVVVFLCSEKARYVTGEDVVVDGGYLRVKRF